MTIYADLEVSEQSDPSAGASFTEQLATADAIRAKAAREDELAAAKNAPKIAAAEAEAERIRHASDEEKEQRERERLAKAEAERKARESDRKARTRAKAGVVGCMLLSLPLQLLAFYEIHPALLAAPFVLEGLSWVWLAQVEAAIDNNRPAGKFRAGALAIAAIVAGINIIHGAEKFDLAVGLAGGLCSLLGPLTWDQHEQSRRRTQGGEKGRVTVWRERRAERKAAKAEDKRIKREEAEAAEREQQIVDAYKKEHPEVWARAVALRAARGELKITPQIWKEAWADVHQLPVGETSKTLTSREEAKARAAEARTPVQATPPGQERAPEEHAQSTSVRTSVSARHGHGFSLRHAPGARRGELTFVAVDTPSKATRTAADTSGRSSARDKTLSPGQVSRKADGEKARQAGVQRTSQGARKSASAAVSTPPRKAATTARIGKGGKTRRTPLTDEQLDEQVRALNPDQPTLSARFVAQHIGCDQARASAALKRVGRAR